MTADKNEWVKWNGQCIEPYQGPLDGDTVIDAKWDDGFVSYAQPASALRWWYDKAVSKDGYRLPSLIAYRVIA